MGPEWNRYTITFSVAETALVTATKSLLLRRARTQLYHARLLRRGPKSSAAPAEHPMHALFLPVSQTLRELPLFESLSSEQIEALVAHSATRALDAGETLFVQGAAQNRAKLICRGCPVRTECLADALDNRIEFGVWGGMTERERRALLRRRPDVTSWRELLENARNHYERTGEDELVAS